MGGLDSNPEGQIVPEEPRKAHIGCGTVALIVFFPPYAFLRYLVPWGWRSANKVFQSHNRTVPPNPTLDMLQTARSVVGFFVVGSTFLYFDEDGFMAFSEQLGNKALLAIIIGLPALFGGTIVFAFRTRPEFRGELVSRALRYSPVTLVYASGMFLSMYIVTEFFPITLPDQGIFSGAALAIGQFVLSGYLVGFWLRALFLIGKNVFNSSETHPLMPCVLTPLIAWSLTVVELLRGSSLPTGVHVFLAISGSVVVTILSIAE